MICKLLIVIEDIEDLIDIKDVNEEEGTMHISENDDGVTLSEAQYEDMRKTIRSLKSHLKESETTCFLMKQVQIENLRIYTYVFMNVYEV